MAKGKETRKEKKKVKEIELIIPNPMKGKKDAIAKR